MEAREIEIESRDRVTHGEYVARIDGVEKSAKLTWSLHDGARAAEHTFVPEELRGRGIAGRLVDRLVADAKSQGFRIVPACSYVAKAFDDHPEWDDLRA